MPDASIPAPTIGRRIKAARALAGWTQAQLAAESGLAEVTIKKIEHTIGRRPHRGTLDAITAALRSRGVMIEEDGVRCVDAG